MVKQVIKTITVFLGLLLIACNNENAFFGTTSTVNSSATSITLLASSTQLGSSGSSPVTVTAIVKDSSNNLVADVPVAFTASSGALAVTQDTTDESGQALAVLGPGGDYTNRTITLTATAGSASQNLAVSVIGTSLTISGDDSVTTGGAAALIITLKDSSNNAIANQTVLVTSALGNGLGSPTLTTNALGQVTVNVNATIAGVDTITASADGATANHTLTVSGDQLQVTSPAANASIDIGTCAAVTISWQQSGAPVANQSVNFSATRGALYSDSGCSSTATSTTTNGSGVATMYVKSNNAGPSTLSAFVTSGPTTSRAVNFVATTPASIDLQAFPATIGPNNGSQAQQQQSTITAVVRDANNNLVASQVVRFSIAQDNSGGTLTTATATTDNLGRAETTYVSSAATTATNADPSVNKTVSLTVAQSPLFVRLGTGNLVGTSGQTSYVKNYTVMVTDASGNAVSGKNVSLAVIPLAYTKGTYEYNVLGDSLWDQVSSNGISTNTSNPQGNSCPSEDVNQNGILDPGEDDPNLTGNGNGKLDPGNVASVPASVTTGSDGTFEFGITYAKQYANWVKVRLVATTSVSGTESSDNAVFWLPISINDISQQNSAPPGMPSPFGLVTGDCNSTN